MSRWHLHQRHIAKHLGHAQAAVPRIPGFASTARSLAARFVHPRAAWYAMNLAKKPRPSRDPG